MNTTGKVPDGRGQVPALYRRKVGRYEVTAVSDGYFDVPDALWIGVAEGDLRAARREAFVPEAGFVRNAVNAFLVDAGERLVLIDAGSGELIPTGGGLADNLARLGVRPQDIDAVLVTHLHPDHIGGLLDRGSAAFPRAALRVPLKDVDYWTDAAEQAASPGFATSWFDAARAVLAAYRDRLDPFDGPSSLDGGIAAVPLPGHTPGHSGFAIEGEGERLLIWGDAAVSAAVQFSRPGAGLAFDVDGDAARRTRRDVFERAADERTLIAGTHLPFPSFGHVARRGSAFAWVPEEWRYTPRR